MSLKETYWEELLFAICEQKCTPFIGAGACVPWLPLGTEIAHRWALKYNYPLEDSGSLSRVAQFLEIDTGEPTLPKSILSREIREKVPPDFSKPKYRNLSHCILADLKLPIYITTNYDKFMELALKSRGVDPASEFCDWNDYAQVANIPSVLKKFKYKPTQQTPLVYHLHGIIDIPQSMVLTENDYYDFVVRLHQEDLMKLLTPIIHTALATTSLLFVGYSLEDINFRIIFKSIMKLLGSRSMLPSIAVQLPPRLTSEKQEQAQRYIDQYTRNMFKVHIYWGDVRDFLRELRDRWEKFKC
jgi:hypothetical protein